MRVLTEIEMISDVIREKLGITMTVLMGANLANEVADENFVKLPLVRTQKWKYVLVMTEKENVPICATVTIYSHYISSRNQ